jgi:hypothetical protein
MRLNVLITSAILVVCLNNVDDFHFNDVLCYCRTHSCLGRGDRDYENSSVRCIDIEVICRKKEYDHPGCPFGWSVADDCLLVSQRESASLLSTHGITN